jgi:hypothetical protein
MGYDSKGILVFNMKYEHAISFINLVNFIIKCQYHLEIIFMLFLNTTLFYNCMLPVNRYLAMNTFWRSMTYFQKSYSLPLEGRLLRRGNMKLHALLGHHVSENFVSWCQTLKNSSASFLCLQETYRSSPRYRNLKVIEREKQKCMRGSEKGS